MRTGHRRVNFLMKQSVAASVIKHCEIRKLFPSQFGNFGNDADQIAPFRKSPLAHAHTPSSYASPSRDILAMDFWRKMMMPSPVSRKRDPSPPVTPEARLERYKRGWAAVKVTQASPSISPSTPPSTLPSLLLSITHSLLYIS